MNELSIELVSNLLPNSILIFSNVDSDIKLYKQEFMGASPVWDINMLELLNLKELRFIYGGYVSLEISKNFLVDRISLKAHDWI